MIFMKRILAAVCASLLILASCGAASKENPPEITEPVKLCDEKSEFKWSMSVEQVRCLLDPTAKTIDFGQLITVKAYSQMIYEQVCDVNFDFWDDKLDGVDCYYNAASDKAEQKSVLEALRTAIAAEYGSPDKEKTSVNGSKESCTYIEWYEETVHIMLTAYLEKPEDFEVHVSFYPADYSNFDYESTSASSKYKLPNGELLDETVTGNTLIIKAKIKPSFNNHATVSQNFFNLEDLIINQGCEKYDEIQYWAVADMEDGSESKVISFTAPKSTIDGIKDGSITAIAYLDEYGYLNDVYFLPSLKE